MHDRWINTLDDDRFALEKVRYVVDGLTSRDQNFIVMVCYPLVPPNARSTPRSSLVLPTKALSTMRPCSLVSRPISSCT